MNTAEKNITDKLGEQLAVLNGERQAELGRIIDMAVLVAGEFEKQRAVSDVSDGGAA